MSKKNIKSTRAEIAWEMEKLYLDSWTLIKPENIIEEYKDFYNALNFLEEEIDKN